MRKIASLKLTAQVRRRPGKVRLRVLTDVTIRLDGKAAVAYRRCAGSLTELQAIKEFRDYPYLFEPLPGFDKESVLALAKV